MTLIEKTQGKCLEALGLAERCSKKDALLLRVVVNEAYSAIKKEKFVDIFDRLEALTKLTDDLSRSMK